MNKKGFELSWRVLMETALVLVVIVSLVSLAVRIYRVTDPQPDAETLNNFKRLAGEINDLAKDIEEQDKEQADITIPLFIKRGYYVVFYHEGNEESLPRTCRKESCICLLSAEAKIKIYCVQTKNVYMMGPTKHFDSFPVIVPDDKEERPFRTLKLNLILTANKITGVGLYRLKSTIEQKEKQS
jgi:hypothetical protein